MKKIQKKITMFSILFFVFSLISVEMFSQPCLNEPGQLEKGQVNFSGGDIVLLHDGNADPDDILAMPMALAMIEAAGFKDNVVHVEYAINLCKDNGKVDDMAESASLASERLGYDSSIFYNSIAQREQALNHLVSIINRSTNSNPVWIAAAGPMEVLWRALDNANSNKLSNVIIMSHSTGNENNLPFCNPDKTDFSHTKNWDNIKADFKQFGITIVENSKDNPTPEGDFGLLDQNGKGTVCSGFNGDLENWDWIINTNNPKYSWIHERNQKPNEYDASDSGITFYMLTGGPFNEGCQSCGSVHVEALFNNQPNEESNYFYITNKDTGGYLRPLNNNFDSKLQAIENDGSDWFKWEKENTSEGYFILRNKETGKPFRPSTNGSLVQQKGVNWRGNAVQWKDIVSPDRNSVHIRNRASGQHILPVSGSNTDIQGRPSSWTGDRSRWFFEEATSNTLRNRSVINQNNSVNDLQKSIKIYPNPVSNYLNITNEVSQTIEIYDVSGTMVKKHTLKGDQIDVSNFSKGVYFIKIGNKIGKFVKK